MTKKSALSAAVALGLAMNCQASDQEGWQFDLVPYVWGANVNADIDRGANRYSIDNDTWENIDGGFMGMGAISYNRFVFYLDYDYLSLSDDAKTKNGIIVPVGTEVDADFDINIATGGIGYRFDTWGENSWIDVLVGIRNLKLDREITVAGQHLNDDEDVTDPLILLRPSFRIAENWRFTGLFGVGISGDSESTYELMPQVQYSFNELLSVRFGYKKISYDINEGGSRGDAGYRSFDGEFSGPFVGVGFTFPSKAKPAPAPAPLPPPPPPAKCADSDHDGVCDTADQCPNTPPGKRVGPGGCDCDYSLVTHFAFDSAKLTDEDKDALDKLAKVLVNPKLGFITGKVDGYTDATGKPEYNQKLSERRAQAVADYLHSKGVATDSKMSVEGFGESDPVADNKTEDGRVQNRRVIIRRTDCGSR